MTNYTDDTPVTPDLLHWAIAIEMSQPHIDWPRVRRYMVARYAMTRDDDDATSAVFKPKS